MNSPLAYIGGKSILSKTIVKLIPSHITYCEAFTGGGWMLFRKEPSKAEIINDLDRDLVAFYRVIQNHLEEFLKQFKWLLTSREMFEDFKEQLEVRGLTDIQRAARYYYVQRTCFAGKVRGRTFGVSSDRKPRINLVRMEEELSEVHLRLSQVLIENLSWDEFISRYDRPATFFYLDPPYYKKPVYKHNFESIDDFIRMRDILKGLKGKFILSINDHPEIREVFNGFRMVPVSLNYTAGMEVTAGRELIIGNVPLKLAG
ncbi:MAG: DNA adenine methylase [Spirochaetes bacterium]|nr:MAG: DNA adenine methylase [Spirochaetota bacterium]